MKIPNTPAEPGGARLIKVNREDIDEQPEVSAQEREPVASSSHLAYPMASGADLLFWSAIGNAGLIAVRAIYERWMGRPLRCKKCGHDV